LLEFGGKAFLQVSALVLLEVVRQEEETGNGWNVELTMALLCLEKVSYLQAIIATEALASKMEGTTLYGRRTRLAMENPRVAIEREISGLKSPSR
jgi:hypothetical protein